MNRTPCHARFVAVAFSAISLFGITAARCTLYASNATVQFGDESGRCYARSVPSRGQGSEGKTRIFRVRKSGDELVQKFPWYSRRLAIKCGNIGPDGKISISVVRMGTGWASRTGETSGSVTLAFYLDGRLLAEYSRMDIAVLPDTARRQSGYPRSGYGKVLGFSRSGRRDVFEICSYYDRILTFDISNGDLVGEYNDYPDRCGARQ